MPCRIGGSVKTEPRRAFSDYRLLKNNVINIAFSVGSE